MRKYLCFVCLFWLPGLVFSRGLEGHWTLEKSSISYKVTHPLHVVIGKSLSARGKGVCYGDGHCEFFVAVPVKTFDSGDNNRDLHMLEVTKGALFPMVEVTIEWKKSGDPASPKKLTVDAHVKFAGKMVEYPKVHLNILEWDGDQAHIAGELPLSLKDFEIQPPALLTLPIQDAVPVSLDTWWHRTNLVSRR